MALTLLEKTQQEIAKIEEILSSEENLHAQYKKEWQDMQKLMLIEHLPTRQMKKDALKGIYILRIPPWIEPLPYKYDDYRKRLESRLKVTRNAEKRLVKMHAHFND